MVIDYDTGAGFLGGLFDFDGGLGGEGEPPVVGATRRRLRRASFWRRARRRR